MVEKVEMLSVWTSLVSGMVAGGAEEEEESVRWKKRARREWFALAEGEGGVVILGTLTLEFGLA